MTGISRRQVGTDPKAVSGPAARARHERRETTKGPLRGPSHRAALRLLADGPYVRRLGTLLPLSSLELDLRTFGQGLEALAADAAVVDEQILRSVIGGDEAVPLLVAEPLHGSGCQLTHLPQLPTGAAAAAARIHELWPRATHTRALELLFVPGEHGNAADVGLLVRQHERAAAT